MQQCYFSYNTRTCSPIETKAMVTLYCIAFGADTKRYQGYVHTRKDGFTPARKSYRIGQT